MAKQVKFYKGSNAKVVSDGAISFNTSEQDKGIYLGNGTSAEKIAELNVQPDWKIDDDTSGAYIKNKPNIQEMIDDSIKEIDITVEGCQSDWNEKDTSSDAYIKNKPIALSELEINKICD